MKSARYYTLRSNIFASGAVALVCGLAATVDLSADTPQPTLLNYTNHWAGNTGGKGGHDEKADDISNFVIDIGVLNTAELNDQMAPYAPLVITKSYWDETNWADGAYSHGIRVSKGEFFNKNMVFDASTYNGITATIAHPHELDSSIYEDRVQQNAEDQGIPLFSYPTNIPFVALSDGRTIKSVNYPTSVAFDESGNLWVADNGPDQNFKIFSIPATGAPTLVTTFGETGGVFAGPVRGGYSEKRFWGVRGVCFGDNGQIIVGCSGIPGQIQGGTDIRWFDSTDSSTLAKRLSTASMSHQAIGTFLHVADFDPASNGTELYHASLRYTMDYSKPPGQSWKISGVTLDPFRFPDDPRLWMPFETAFFRRIEGKRFLFCLNMNASYMGVFRFEENSEIAIPAALFYLFSNGHGADWAKGIYPTLPDSSQNYMWVDKNGDGKPQTGEFSGFVVANSYSEGYDIDANGNIWMSGGQDVYSTQWGTGGSWVLPNQGLDANGVPQYDGTKIERLGVGSGVLLPIDLEISRSAARLRYLADTDTMVMGVGYDAWYPRRVYVIDGYRNSNNPTRRSVIDIGYDIGGAWEVHLDQGTASMVVPMSFTADNQYLYVTYLDIGPNTRARGEVTIYDLNDGHQIGWVGPNADTNFASAGIDLVVGVHVQTRTDGSRVICVEDDGNGKVMVYHWTPPVTSGPSVSTTGSGAVGPVIVTQPQKLTKVEVGETLSVDVIAVGTDLQYQWKKNGANIPGANQATYRKDNFSNADVANYSVTIWNSTQTVTSTAGAAQIVYPPTITAQPAATTNLVVGSAFTLSVTATGTDLNYQWTRNGNALQGANSSTYEVTTADDGDAGTYTVIVFNMIKDKAATSTNAVVQKGLIGSSSSSSSSGSSGGTQGGGGGGGAQPAWVLVLIGTAACTRLLRSRKRTGTGC
ncbi:MAG: immunoglobulin domain-containing protein [Verrucomicrobia bacterium]|nr:immunoglobulin domain-containing protein [Verrucomicrobiota bacterium]